MTSAVAQVTTDAGGMAEAASKLESVNAELQAMLKDLMNRLSGLESTWMGLGAQAFQEVKTQYANDLTTLNNALLETADAISKSGKGYQNTDTEAASRVSGAGGSGISLPL